MKNIMRQKRQIYTMTKDGVEKCAITNKLIYTQKHTPLPHR